MKHCAPNHLDGTLFLDNDHFEIPSYTTHHPVIADKI